MVLTLSASSRAASETVFPEAIRHMTWYSRWERGSWGSASPSLCTMEAKRSAREALTYFPPVDTFRVEVKAEAPAGSARARLSRISVRARSLWVRRRAAGLPVGVADCLMWYPHWDGATRPSRQLAYRAGLHYDLARHPRTRKACAAEADSPSFRPSTRPNMGRVSQAAGGWALGAPAGSLGLIDAQKDRLVLHNGVAPELQESGAEDLGVCEPGLLVGASLVVLALDPDYGLIGGVGLHEAEGEDHLLADDSCPAGVPDGDIANGRTTSLAGDLDRDVTASLELAVVQLAGGEGVGALLSRLIEGDVLLVSEGLDDEVATVFPARRGRGG